MKDKEKKIILGLEFFMLIIHSKKQLPKGQCYKRGKQNNMDS